MIINKDFTFESLKKEIKNNLDKNLLSYKIVFLFDDSVKFTDNQLQEIVEMCKDRTLYFVLTSDINTKEETESTKWILLHSKLHSNLDYLMSDQIHLTKLGNQELVKELKEKIGEDNKNDN